MTEPDYRTIQPPEDKPREEYTYVERRAELYNMIENVGHYRNLYAKYSTRELGRRYGVSYETIRNDVQAINEWQADNLADGVEHELETLKNKAIQKYIDDGNVEKAYYLMNTHYELLMEAGLKDRAPDQHEVEHSGEMEWRQYIESAEDDE